MRSKVLSFGTKIDDNRSINCGVSISNQNNPDYRLLYDYTNNEFYFISRHRGDDTKIYMENVSEYINALADIIQAMAEANEFVNETK